MLKPQDILLIGPYSFRVLKIEARFAVLAYTRDQVSYIVRVELQKIMQLKAA